MSKQIIFVFCLFHSKNRHSFKSSEDIKNNCPLYLVLSLDHHQKAHGNFFMDDGSSYNYEKVISAYVFDRKNMYFFLKEWIILRNKLHI